MMILKRCCKIVCTCLTIIFVSLCLTAIVAHEHVTSSISTLEFVVEISTILIILVCIIMHLAGTPFGTAQPQVDILFLEVIFLALLAVGSGITDTVFEWPRATIIHDVYHICLLVLLIVIPISKAFGQPRDFLQDFGHFIYIGLCVQIIGDEVKQTLQNLYLPHIRHEDVEEKSPIHQFMEAAHFALAAEVMGTLILHHIKQRKNGETQIGSNNGTNSIDPILPDIRKPIIGEWLNSYLSQRCQTWSQRAIVFFLTCVGIFLGPGRFVFHFVRNELAISSYIQSIFLLLYTAYCACMTFILMGKGACTNEYQSNLKFKLLIWGVYANFLFNTLIVSASALFVSSDMVSFVISISNIFLQLGQNLMQNGSLYHLMASAGMFIPKNDPTNQAKIKQNIEQIFGYVLVIFFYNGAAWGYCIWSWKKVRMLDAVTGGDVGLSAGPIWGFIVTTLFPIIIYYRFHVVAVCLNIFFIYAKICWQTGDSWLKILCSLLLRRVNPSASPPEELRQIV